MAKFLITSDPHLTVRPVDEYRWGIFDWLLHRLRGLEYDALFLLGDLTDQKDNHSADLVNRVVDNLRRLAAECRVYVLMGNHDYVEPTMPFFGFTEDSHHLRFIREPLLTGLRGHQVLFLPHTKHWRSDWKDLKEPFGEADLICMHQTVTGAAESNGFELTGLPPGVFDRTSATIVSGDVHAPQQVGRVWYCGAPHPVRFGDTYQPRVLVWNDGKVSSIKRTTIRKDIVTVTSVEELRGLGYGDGDQVRVVYSLPRSEFTSWDEYQTQVREVSEAQGWRLCGLSLHEQTRQRLRENTREQRLEAGTGKDTLDQFCVARGVAGPLARVGHDLLERSL